MTEFEVPVQIRWADLDPNFHLRHSVYYDWGVICRVAFLNAVGFTTGEMQRSNLGPVLLREECVFKKEIRLEDTVTIGMKVVKAKKDYSRWTVQHDILKEKNLLAAILTVDIAWMDTVRRKLTVLPEKLQALCKRAPMAENIQWLD